MGFLNSNLQFLCKVFTCGLTSYGSEVWCWSPLWSWTHDWEHTRDPGSLHTVQRGCGTKVRCLGENIFKIRHSNYYLTSLNSAMHQPSWEADEEKERKKICVEIQRNLTENVKMPCEQIKLMHDPELCFYGNRIIIN